MIKEYFQGKTVFITGATGFLGQPLVEKLLWSVPEIRRIYVLIRPKKQFGGRVLSAQDRLAKELYQSSAFDRLQARHQLNFQAFLEEKLVAVAGDISRDDLGIDADERERLIEEVDIVINSAAVVSFDAPLNEALDLNIMGARRVAEFAVACRNAVLIHVSTAYVCGAAEGDVPETLHHTANSQQSKETFPKRAFTDVEADLARIRQIIEEVSQSADDPRNRRRFAYDYVKRARKWKGRRRVQRRQEVENLRRRWIAEKMAEAGMAWARERGWNDTYTYTKALGEQFVARCAARIPVAIVRPAVIESSLSEPSPGWLDGLRMADPLIVAIGKGRLRSLPLNPSVTLDLVPADMVVNATLALTPTVRKKDDLKIIQVATSSRNPITLGTLNELIFQYFRGNPMIDREGRPIRVRPLRFPAPSSFRIQHRLKAVPLETAHRTLERLPSFEAAQKARRRVSATKAAHERLYYYGALYEPYLNLNCQFSVDRTMELYGSLSESERAEFDFDVRRLNWRHYVQNVHIPGVKKFILKIEGLGALELPGGVQDPTFPSTIRELIQHSSQSLPDQVALQIRRKGGWTRYTYGEIWKQARLVAARLKTLGLEKGDRVVLFSENQPEWGICYVGANLLGLVVVPLDAQTWHREVWSVTEFTESRALLASAKGLKRLTAEELARNETSSRPVAILNVDQLGRPFELASYPRSTTFPGLGDCEALNEENLPEVLPEDPVSIIFTTGTSVDPKGAVHTHQSFLNNLRGVNFYLSLSAADRLVSILPLYHALEFTCGFLMPLYRNSTVTYVQTLKPKAILETMRETRTTCMLGVPTLYALIRDDLERRVLKTARSPLKNNLVVTSRRLSHSLEQTLGRNLGKKLFSKVHGEFGGQVRFLVSGGSTLGRGLYRDFRAMGVPIYEGYGLTETAPVLTVNPLHRSRESSAGKPLPGVELRLYRPDQDGIGEIIVKTPSIMTGYYRNPEATERAFRDGWFHTGDLGWVDADGYIYITGRCKDVIVTGAGKNVYPTDLEAIYSTLPSIREICVCGVRSGLTEDVHALIWPDPEQVVELSTEEAKKLVQGEIQELARELPSYQRLQSVHLRTEPLPRHEDGSLDRAAIFAEIAGVSGRAPEGRVVPEGGRRESLIAELSRLSGLDPEEISEDKNLYMDLGLDSLMAVELLLFVERNLGVAISDERAASFQTVGDIFDELRRRKVEDASNGKGRPALRTVRSALPYEERSASDRMVMKTSFALIRTVFERYFSLTVENAEVVPGDGPYILAANHSSHLDSAAVIAAMSLAVGLKKTQQMHVIGARDYFFDSRFKSWLFSTCLNVVPIERDEIGLSGLRMVGAILSQGEPVLIFPEGTRSRTGQLQEFKPGVGLIAWEYKVPIIPVHIEGAYAAMPAGKTLPSRQPIKVRFGEPRRMDQYGELADQLTQDELYRRIAADLRQSVAALEAAALGEGQEESAS